MFFRTAFFFFRFFSAFPSSNRGVNGHLEWTFSPSLCSLSLMVEVFQRWVSFCAFICDPRFKKRKKYFSYCR